MALRRFTGWPHDAADKPLRNTVARHQLIIGYNDAKPCSIYWGRADSGTRQQ